jgi:hypothetical protein
MFVITGSPDYNLSFTKKKKKKPSQTMPYAFLKNGNFSKCLREKNL